MKRAASECSDNDVFFDDGDMLKDGSVIRIYTLSINSSAATVPLEHRVMK